MADPRAVERSGPWICCEWLVVYWETPHTVLHQSLKSIKGDLLLFFQMCSSNVDTEMYKTLTGISDKIQHFHDEHCELLQTD